MKVLFNHNHRFQFVDGGAQAMIEQMRLALLQVGVEVDCQRWPGCAKPMPHSVWVVDKVAWG